MGVGTLVTFRIMAPISIRRAKDIGWLSGKRERLGGFGLTPTPGCGILAWFEPPWSLPGSARVSRAAPGGGTQKQISISSPSACPRCRSGMGELAAESHRLYHTREEIAEALDRVGLEALAERREQVGDGGRRLGVDQSLRSPAGWGGSSRAARARPYGGWARGRRRATAGSGPGGDRALSGVWHHVAGEPLQGPEGVPAAQAPTLKSRMTAWMPAAAHFVRAAMHVSG